jgi:hypothetical protein
MIGIYRPFFADSGRWIAQSGHVRSSYVCKRPSRVTNSTAQTFSHVLTNLAVFEIVGHHEAGLVVLFVMLLLLTASITWVLGRDAHMTRPLPPTTKLSYLGCHRSSRSNFIAIATVILEPLQMLRYTVPAYLFPSVGMDLGGAYSVVGFDVSGFINDHYMYSFWICAGLAYLWLSLSTGLVAISIFRATKHLRKLSLSLITVLSSLFFVPITRQLFSWLVCTTFTEGETVGFDPDYTYAGPRLLLDPRIGCFSDEHMPYFVMATVLGGMYFVSVSTISPYFVDDLTGKNELR